jgi:tetratricopeptide (TPR) repeat protein
MHVHTRELQRYVVRVETVDGEIRGAGFFVAPGWVLTCAHVVKEDLALHLRLATDLNGPPMTGDVKAASKAPEKQVGLWPFPDLAVIRLRDGTEHPCVLLSPEDPLGEDECAAWGFPRREEEADPQGTTASFGWEGPEGDGYLKLKQGQAKPGLSGAPLVCPGRRAVVGVVVGTRGAGGDLGAYASPVAALLLGGRGVPKQLTAIGDEIREANPSAVIAQRLEWARVLPVPDSEELLEQPWGRFTRQPRSTPSDLLRADFGVVPYMFRDRELDDATDWCESDAPLAVMQVAGGGGAGKTRFALELCKRLGPRGWVAGLWRPGQSLARVPLPRLLVVDYAEDVDTKSLRDELDALRRRATAIAPVRVVLLTRINAVSPANPLSALRESAPAVLKTVLDRSEDSDSFGTGLMPKQRAELFDRALAEFADAWHPASATDATASSSTSQLPDLTRTHALPLDVLFEALDAMLAQEVTANGGHLDPVDRVLNHEERYWRAASQTVPNIDHELQRQCVALSTLASAKDVDEAHSLLAVLDGLQGEESAAHRQEIISWIEGLYDGPDLLNPLRPDRLGEALISRVLHKDDAFAHRMLTGVLALSSSDQLAHSVEVLVRVCTNSADIATATGRILSEQHVALVQRAEASVARAISPDNPDLIGSLARLFATTLPAYNARPQARGEPSTNEQRRALSISIQRLGDLARVRADAEEAERLYKEALAITEKLAAREPANAQYQRDLSVSFNRLGDLARARADAEEAERLYKEALAIAEKLAAREPANAEYQRDLSISFDRLGDLARARADTEEAERLYKQDFAIAEKLAAREPANAEYQRDLSISLELLGDLARARGDTEGAERLYKEALAIREKLAAHEPANAQYQRDLSVSFNRLGGLARARGDTEEAERLHKEALAIAEKLAAREPANAQYQRDLSLSFELLGGLARARGDTEGAERLYKEALAIREKLAAREPANAEYQRDLSVSFNRLGGLARARGDTEEAERLYKQDFAIAEKLAAREPANAQYQRDLSVSLNRLGDLARARADTEGAERLYKEALAIAEKLAAREPANAEYQRDLSVSFDQLAGLARVRGDTEGAERLYKQDFAIAEKLAAREPANAEYQRDLSLSFNRLGDLARARGDTEEAERLYKEALAIREKLAAHEPANAQYQRDLSVSFELLGDLAGARGDTEGAERLYKEALAIREKLAAHEPANAQYQRDLSVSFNRLGGLARAPGDTEGAERLYMEALAIAEKLAAREPANAEYQRDLSFSFNRLADLARVRGDTEGAERLYMEALAIAEKLAAREPANAEYQRDLSFSFNRLADLARVRGDTEGAERLYKQALAIREKLAAREPANAQYQRDLSFSFNRLADLARARGDTEQAERLLAAAHAIREKLPRRELD